MLGRVPGVGFFTAAAAEAGDWASFAEHLAGASDRPRLWLARDYLRW